jgi:DNA-binding PadR family transcriptional regulator
MGARVVTDKNAPVMRSPVSWALLGLVIERPSYGYEFVQRFERTYGDALQLSSFSQIYTALDLLERNALIEKLPSPPAADGGRQPKPHYQATPEGLRRYQDWLIAQVHEERRRSRLFARQLAVLDPQAALAVIDRYEQVCLQETKTTPLGSTDERSASGAPSLAGRLVCQEDRRAVGARLSWIEYARSEFEALAAERGLRR